MQAKPFTAGREVDKGLFFRQHFSPKNVTFPNSIKVAPFVASNLTQLSKMLTSFSHALRRVDFGESRKNREKLNCFDRPIPTKNFSNKNEQTKPSYLYGYLHSEIIL